METEQNCNILTPTLMAVSVVFSCSPGLEAQGPSSPLDDGLSPTGLQNSIGGPEGSFGREWLSLPHLLSNFSGPQLIRGPNSIGFFLPCPISSAKSAHAISFDYWPLECITSFRCITLEWHVCPGRRSKYNNNPHCYNISIYIYINIHTKNL